MIRFVLLMSIFFIALQPAMSQSINQKDANGKRHGVWQKRYTKSKALRYEGQFDHGKEIGTFKFYCENCGSQPEVIKEFNANDATSLVSFFSKEGVLLSKGKMDGKNHIGEWLYYSESGNVIIREQYTNGKLEGYRVRYYEDGRISEKTGYVNGLEEGVSVHYSVKGVAVKKLLYRNGLLEGPAEYYDNNGTMTKKGAYKEGAKFGSWTYFKDGRVLFDKNY